MYHVGLCPICGNGLRGIRVCCETPVVVCDECDALWTSPSIESRVSSRSDPTCDRCQQSLWGTQSHWASRSEVEQAGWSEQIAGEIVERTSSRGPAMPDEIRQMLDGSEEATAASAPSAMPFVSRHIAWIIALMAAVCAFAILALL